MKPNWTKVGVWAIVILIIAGMLTTYSLSMIGF